MALGDAVIALSTNIAMRENRRIEFKNEWFDIDSDETPEGVKPDLSRYASTTRATARICDRGGRISHVGRLHRADVAG